MNNTPKRRGRPVQPYFFKAGNEFINGLRRRKNDGRWVIVSTGEMFTEPDERRAIQHFLNRTGNPAVLKMEIPLSSLPALTLPPKMPETQEGMNVMVKSLLKNTKAMVAAGTRINLDFRKSMTPADWTAEFNAPSHFVWAWMRDQIIERPKFVAEMIGIEQIGYLDNLKKPEPLPTFEAIETLWIDHGTAKMDGKRKQLADWKQFVSMTGIKTIKDITIEICVKYRQQIYALNLSGKRQQHLFNNARRILNFAISQAVAVSHCTTALQYMKIMSPNTSATSINPNPIEPKDFTALLDKATGDDKAMVLLTLNAALHLQELVNLRWDDIHGEFLIAHRAKKGKFLRIATLWPETIAALNEIKRRGDFIFTGKTTGAPLTVFGCAKRFRKLRKEAGVAHVESDQLRDGAATAVAAANVHDQLFNLLMGHRNPGMKDQYAKRRPNMVRPACDAIYAEYMMKVLQPA